MASIFSRDLTLFITACTLLDNSRLDLASIPRSSSISRSWTAFSSSNFAIFCLSVSCALREYSSNPPPDWSPPPIGAPSPPNWDHSEEARSASASLLLSRSSASCCCVASASATLAVLFARLLASLAMRRAIFRRLRVRSGAVTTGSSDEPSTSGSAVYAPIALGIIL